MGTLDLLNEMILGVDDKELHNHYNSQLEKLSRVRLTDEKKLRFDYKMRILLLTEGRKHTKYKPLVALYSNLIQVIQSTLDGDPPTKKVWDAAFEAFEYAHTAEAGPKMVKAVAAQSKSYRKTHGIYDDLAGHILLALEQETDAPESKRLIWN